MGGQQSEEMRVFVCLVVAFVAGVCAVSEPAKHHANRALQDPISMEIDELQDQQNLQIGASASLSDAGPLTRADYGGEAPYETREVEEEVQPKQDLELMQGGPIYKMASVDEEENNADISNTVPRLLPDGRLVHVPMQAKKPAAPVPKSGSAVRMEDVEALELGEGAGVAAKQDPPAPFPGPKVRVSSLVSGILSSVLSSVLTRGMNFASAGVAN